MQARRFHAAARAYALIVERTKSARVAWEYGATLAALDDHRAALAAFDRSLALDPRLSQAWNDRGVSLTALHRNEEAEESFLRALKKTPCRSAASTNLANLRLARGDVTGAETLYRSALRDDPTNTHARIGLGRLLAREGRYADAGAEHERARRYAPYDFDALVADVAFRLSTGVLDGALAAAEQFLSLSPSHRGGLGLRAELEREAGDGWHTRLLEVESWVKVVDVEVSPSSLARVAEALSSHPTWSEAPPHHATRSGSHSAALCSSHDDALAELEPFFEKALQAYVPPAHAAAWWQKTRPGAVALHTWAVSLGGDGYQVPHLHPNGWLSGVFYVAVPEHVEHGAESSAGCFELGRPDPELFLVAPRPSHFIRPRPGRLVIFPSWFYHSTVPHGGAGTRLSIAFDCVSAAP